MVDELSIPKPTSLSDSFAQSSMRINQSNVTMQPNMQKALDVDALRNACQDTSYGLKNTEIKMQTGGSFLSDFVNRTCQALEGSIAQFKGVGQDPNALAMNNNAPSPLTPHWSPAPTAF